MRIALDARLTRQMSVGMKTYARELAQRLPRVAPEFDFVPFTTGENFTVAEQIVMPFSLRTARVGLTHFLSLYVPLAAPRPLVLTIHDLIHLRFPQYFKTKVRPYYQTAVRLACARALAVITDDPRTIGDMQRYLSVPARKVRVVPLGVDERYLQPIAPFNAPRPYLLYVGNHRPHKDVPTLFRAWAALPPDLVVDLYLTGADDFGEDLRGYTRPGSSVITLGDISQEKLAAYYAGAAALVHPALCEGFGLPMLEAMAAGCPVIASSDAIPAALADAGLTFAAGDAAAASAAIERVLRDAGVARALVIQGQARARTLTWDRCARLTADVYRELLEEHRR